MSYDEKRCLQVNVFDGDFGSPTDKCLKNKIVTARKRRNCSTCYREIMPGTRIRVSAHIFDGELHHYSWCEKCCEALARSWDDNGESYELRIIRGKKHTDS